MSTDTSSIINGLDALDDDGLRTVIDRARSLLIARKDERTARIVQNIRSLGAGLPDGLSVKIVKKKAKRGRPRKSEAAAP